MELSICAQAVSLLFACGLGAGLGLLYDLLRPIRRRFGNGFWDFLFCLCSAASAFLFAMRSENGMLGTGEVLLALLSLLLYFQLLSPFLLPHLDACVRKIGVLCVNTQNSAKKVRRSVKKLFQNLLG
ncbi:MAG: hypothetical protein II885_05050 [Oscillospiraceae bacterium]|nr:hypothetical protein [Oscillospiraceae bacterium]